MQSYRIVRNFALLAIFGLGTITLTGCAGKYTGGGFIDSATGEQSKATFGFNLEGVDRDGDGLVDIMVVPLPDIDYIYVVWGLGKGQFSYNDHAAGIRFHLDCDVTTELPANSSPDSCNAVPNDDFTAIRALNWLASYTSKGGGGTASVTVTAKGDSLNNVDDTLEVYVYDGPYAGYSNAGTIKGGNIQWHPAK